MLFEHDHRLGGLYHCRPYDVPILLQISIGMPFGVNTPQSYTYQTEKKE